MHQLRLYIVFLFKAFHLHGIHSPFVFKLEKECLRGKNSPEVMQRFADYKNELLSSKKVIAIKDYGAGSRVFKTNQRAVAAIAKNAGATQRRMLLLQRMVAYFQPEQTLELGTSLGLATLALAINNTSEVTSIEGCPNTAAVAKNNLDKASITNVNLCIGTFEEELEKVTHRTFDLIYFDGNHSKEATLRYVKTLLKTATNHTVWIFDDIHWSKEMTAAWEDIKTNPQITITIDCFWFGMVFFRKEQAKEDFYISLEY